MCQSSHISSQQSSFDENASHYAKLIDAVKILYPENWIEDVDLLFGENEINDLCTGFSLSIRPAVREFRNIIESKFKSDRERTEASNVSCRSHCRIDRTMRTRLYSCMNLTVSNTHNSLAIPTVSSLRFLKLVGPPLHQFQPLLYVESWLAKGHHAMLLQISTALRIKIIKTTKKLKCPQCGSFVVFCKLNFYAGSS